MAKVLTAFSQYYQHPTIVALGGVEYTVRYTWRDRSNSWYVDFLTVDGEQILMGRRMQPGIGPNLRQTLETMPGSFMVLGADCYTIDDLGKSLLPMWFAPGELPPIEPDVDYRIVAGDQSLPMTVL